MWIFLKFKGKYLTLSVFFYSLVVKRECVEEEKTYNFRIFNYCSLLLTQLAVLYEIHVNLSWFNFEPTFSCSDLFFPTFQVTFTTIIHLHNFLVLLFFDKYFVRILFFTRMIHFTVHSKQSKGYKKLNLKRETPQQRNSVVTVQRFSSNCFFFSSSIMKIEKTRSRCAFVENVGATTTKKRHAANQFSLLSRNCCCRVEGNNKKNISWVLKYSQQFSSSDTHSECFLRGCLDSGPHRIYLSVHFPSRTNDDTQMNSFHGARTASQRSSIVAALLCAIKIPQLSCIPHTKHEQIN